MVFYVKRRGKGLLLLKPEIDWPSTPFSESWRGHYTTMPKNAQAFQTRHEAEACIWYDHKGQACEQVIDETQVVILLAIRAANHKRRSL